MFGEDAAFSLDVGTDEQLELPSGAHERIAALEIKLECRRRPTAASGLKSL